MKQFFAPYIDWEDYQNGMYTMRNDDDELLIRKSMKLLKDENLFLSVAKKVIKEWNVTTKCHLTNNEINKKAWLGQASCSYHFKVPELLTRVAWGKLTKFEQDKANSVAEKVINSYLLNIETSNPKLHL